MNFKHILFVAACAASTLAWGQQRAPRQSVLMNAKNLVLTTAKGDTYYYLVSSEDNPVIDLTGEGVRILNDEFALSDIASLRFRALSRILLDEDSTTYDKTKSVDHGLLALRRSFEVGHWNSLVLPVALTSEQITDAFGEGTIVAQPRGFRENDVTVVEFETIDLAPGETVMKAGYHYLVRPTREADLAADSWTSSFISGQRIYGPVYMIPNVSTATNVRAPRLQAFTTGDETASVWFRGTFFKLDDSVVNGSVVYNKRIDAGTYMLSDDQMVKNQEPAEVKAFTSWVLDMTDPKAEQLHFYVDGVNEDISEIVDALPAVSAAKSADNADIYDLGGRRIGTAAQRSSLQPGIYVIGGKKVVVK
ncbi:MAG: hypothetical protein K6A32_09410 [Bacteroidales bacterium]|nr:hypothetical protein [Bacteroidales bacterium]